MSWAVTDRGVADVGAAACLKPMISALAYGALRTTPAFVELHYIAWGVMGRAAVTETTLVVAATAHAEAARGIRGREFAATPSYGACGYCAYNSICPSRARGSF
jgi:hypothetical protein